MSVPLEHAEAIAFVQWMQYKKIDCWHIPQETFTKSWSQKRKNKEAGVRPGISDYMVFLPATLSKTGKAVLLWIELKRQHRTLKNGKKGASPSVVSEEQIDFIKKMNAVSSCQGGIAYGADEAIALVRKSMKRV